MWSSPAFSSARRRRNLSGLLVAASLLLAIAPTPLTTAADSAASAVEINAAGEPVAVSLSSPAGSHDGKEPIVGSSTNDEAAVELAKERMRSRAQDARTQEEDAEPGQSVDADHRKKPKKTTDGWTSVSAVFENRLGFPVRLWFEHSAGPDMNFGVMEPDSSSPVTTYHGNRWYITKVDQNQKLSAVTISEEQSLYVWESLDPDEQAAKDAIRRVADAEKREYEAKTGLKWRNVWPREPVSFFMYDPVEVGHVASVYSSVPQWHKGEDVIDPRRAALEAEKAGETAPELLRMEVKTLSNSPRVFHVSNVLSADECNEIIRIASHPDRLKRSMITTTSVVSAQRTSSNAWIPISENHVIRNIFMRIADVLQIDDRHMKHDRAAENIQAVYYDVNQQYVEHHDYLEPDVYTESANVQRGQNRLATILFYLDLPEEGGETAFPKSDCCGEDGLKVKVPKGDAVLFYSMLPDGNLDFESLHAGLPVRQGKKWVANLWVWEPRWL